MICTYIICFQLCFLSYFICTWRYNVIFGGNSNHNQTMIIFNNKIYYTHYFITSQLFCDNSITWLTPKSTGPLRVKEVCICGLGCPRMFKLVNQCWPQVFLIKYTQRMWENQKKWKIFDIFNRPKPFKVLVHTALYPVYWAQAID